MLASAQMTFGQPVNGETTTIQSPFFLTSDHPKGCFEFWFFFTVDEAKLSMTNISSMLWLQKPAVGQRLEIQIVHADGDIHTVWVLDDAWTFTEGAQNDWYRGMVDIVPKAESEFRVRQKL